MSRLPELNDTALTHSCHSDNPDSFPFPRVVFDLLHDGCNFA